MNLSTVHLCKCNNTIGRCVSQFSSDKADGWLTDVSDLMDFEIVILLSFKVSYTYADEFSLFCKFYTWVVVFMC